MTPTDQPVEPQTPHDLNAMLSQRRRVLLAALGEKEKCVALAEQSLVNARAEYNGCVGALRELDMVIGSLKPILASPKPLGSG